MKKQLSTILRYWADWLYPAPQQMYDRWSVNHYEQKSIGWNVKIDGGMLHRKSLEFRGIGLDDSYDSVVLACVEDAKETISRGLSKTIKDNNLIEYDIDRESMVVRGELKIWTK